MLLRYVLQILKMYASVTQICGAFIFQLCWISISFYCTVLLSTVAKPSQVLQAYQQYPYLYYKIYYQI